MKQSSNVFPADNWTTFKDFYYNHGHQEVRFTNLLLDPGINYRLVVKLCARHICYAPQYSDGVRVIANPPTTGSIVVKHVNITNGKEQVVDFTILYEDKTILCQNGSF